MESLHTTGEKLFNVLTRKMKRNKNAIRFYRRYRNIGLLANMKLLSFTILMLSLVIVAQSQHHITPRAGNQTYFEDSAHVYFTLYPNPFHGVMPTKTTKVHDCYNSKSFYCDLSDSVTVALVDRKDSTVYSAMLKSTKPPFFGFCFWVAGPQFNKALLPSSYFVSNSDTILSLVLLVRDRRKCQTTYRFVKNLYYWIDELYERTQ